tara:strand:- start:1728 stop:1871 length:144 start_codon:yes stop_codon:yes gene_type:complete
MSLSSKEWQLLLILQELKTVLSKKEKNQKLIVWIEEKIKTLEKRSGW